MTNGDKLRHMSDDAIAELFARRKQLECPVDYNESDCVKNENTADCKECFVRWLGKDNGK